MSSTPGEPTDTNFHCYSPQALDTSFDVFDSYDEPGWFDDHMDIGMSEVEIINICEQSGGV